MIDGLFDFFQPTEVVIKKSEDGIRRLADSVLVHHSESIPSIEEARIVIIGVNEARGHAANEGTRKGPDAIRQQLYGMMEMDETVPVVDMGNITEGERLEDTYAAVRIVCAELLRAGKLPVIIGGSQDLTYANYAAYETM